MRSTTALSTVLLLSSLTALARAEPHVDASPLSLDAGVGATSRQFGYRDDVLGALRGLTLTGAPTLRGGVDVFPGAFASSGLAARFGATFSFEQLVGVKTSSVSGGEDLSTVARSYQVGLRTRWPVAEHTLTGGVEYARQIYRVDGGAPFPSVDYQSIRISAGARLALGDGVTIAPEVAVLPTLSSGDVAGDAWFPRARTFGMDASLRAAFDVGHGLAPYLRLSFRRYLIDLRPEPGDAHVAGGASDDFFSASVGLTWSAPPVAD